MAEAETRAEDKLSHRVRFPFQAKVYAKVIALRTAHRLAIIVGGTISGKNILPVALATSVIVGMGITSISTKS